MIDRDFEVLGVRLHLRYDEVLDNDCKMDYKSFTKDNLEFNRLWICSDAKATAAIWQMLGIKNRKEALDVADEMKENRRGMAYVSSLSPRAKLEGGLR